MDEDFQDLKRKQLDEKLILFRNESVPDLPRGGWVKTIRTALGMPSEVLGKRIGISQSAVIQLEASEDNNTISLSSLRKLADGLECDLVYALVPRKSLNDIMKEQARRRAESMVKSVANSMELEGQNVSDQEQQRQIEATAKKLLLSPSTGFWEEA